ncbi:MAG: amidohydrolase family protein [Actinomycetota bacterium]
MPTVFRNATIIDGTGRDPEEGQDFVVDSDGRIVSIGRNLPEEADAHEVDLSGKFVMPGMIDCHFHGVYEEVSCYEDYDLRRPIEESTLYHAKNAQTILESGFTAAREVGTRGLVSVSTSKLIQEGVLRGPRLVPGGRIISSTGGLTDAYGHWVNNEHALGYVVDGVNDVLKAVREQIKYGTKCIKVEASGGGITLYAGSDKQTMTEEEMRAAVHEAHRNGVRVACHAMGTESIKNGVRAGVTTIEHGSFLDEEGVGLMKERGTIMTPTISVLYFYVHKGSEVGFPDWVVENLRAALKSHIESFKMAADNGISMTVGSDSGHAFNPQAGIASELELMVKYGFSPMQAICAATLNGAKAAGISKSIGSLEQGKLADFLVLNSDPLTDIALLQDRAEIKGVYQSGVLKAGQEFHLPRGQFSYDVASGEEVPEHLSLGGECMVPYEVELS